jgi:invasion protein IalB
MAVLAFGQQHDRPRPPQTAQTSPRPAPPQPNPPPQQSAQPQGAVAPAQPAAPTRTETFNFDNWSVVCNDYAEGPRKHTCVAVLKVLPSGSNQIILTWTIGLNDNKQYVAVIQAPTGVLIRPGLELHLEKATPRKLEFESCEPSRCTATLVMDNAFMKDAATAANASVGLQSADGKSVQISFAMKGFDKALAQLRTSH